MGLTSLKVAIIGAGVFGRYHAQKALAHKKVSSVSIYDLDISRARSIGDELGLDVIETFEDALASCDAVIIASPATFHAELALQSLKAGRHCLIEKPLAHELSLAQDICDLAREKNLIVHVGHQERYVLEAIGLNSIVSKPKLIELYRESPYSPRCTDVSSTLDLAVHDMDMVMWLMGGEPLGVLATGRSVETAFIDHSRAELIFDKTKAVIHTSRVANEARRTMLIVYPEGTIEIDFNAKTLVNNSPFMLNENFGDDPRARDALGASDHAFFDAVIGGTSSTIPPEDGMRALEWALEIDSLILGKGL
ncbi:MAG: Gfo/Idh/MocA family oxidoreductase [Maricaulaceae bacterium]